MALATSGTVSSFLTFRSFSIASGRGPGREGIYRGKFLLCYKWIYCSQKFSYHRMKSVRPSKDEVSAMAREAAPDILDTTVEEEDQYFMLVMKWRHEMLLGEWTSH